MTRKYQRILIAVTLSVAIEQLTCELLSTWSPIARLARAQSFSGVNTADPYTPTNNFGVGSPPASIGGYSGNPYLPTNPGFSGPTTPTNPTRPSSWPGGSQDPAREGNGPPIAQRPAGYPQTGPVGPDGYGAAPPPQQAVSQIAPNKKSPGDPPYDPAEILAHVGSEVVQANEVLPEINRYMADVESKAAGELAKLDRETRESELNKYRRELTKKHVDDLVKIKLLVSDARRKIPAEGLTKIEDKMRKDFNVRVIKLLMEQYKATSIIDLDNKLRDYGSSLEAQRTLSVERVLAVSWLGEQTRDVDKQEATHEQMLSFYRDHISDWETPARVRWEQLTVKFINFDSKPQAKSTLAQWGNEIWNGAQFAVVAKAHSQDIAADEGGVHDWTSKGSLRSTVLDDALFSPALPEGKLSQIIEDEEGFHIVRVLNREAAKRVPFSDVQVEIKKRMHDGLQERKRNEYVAKLRDHTPISTVFDAEDKAVAREPHAAAFR